MELNQNKISIRTIRFKLLVIFILNVSDIFLTLYLLSSDLYFEANPIIKPMINDLSLCILFKVVLPALLLLYVSIRIGKATPRQLRYSNYLLISVIIVYGLINFSHIIGVVIITYIFIISVPKAAVYSC